MDNLKLAVVWDVFFAPLQNSVNCTVDFVHKRVEVSTRVSAASFALCATPLLQSFGLPVNDPVSTWNTSREPQNGAHANAWAQFVQCFVSRHALQVTPWKDITFMSIEGRQTATHCTFTCTAVFDEDVLKPTLGKLDGSVPKPPLDPLEAWEWSHQAHADAY